MSFLNIYNNDYDQHCSSIMGSRISFSADFMDGPVPVKYRDPPVSSDFEFSVSGYSMISADEAFFKGKLLPLKENCSYMGSMGSNTNTTTTTLREELSVNDDEHEHDHDHQYVLRKIPRRSPVTWRERFGLKKAQIRPKRADNNKEEAYGSKKKGENM